MSEAVFHDILQQRGLADIGDLQPEALDFVAIQIAPRKSAEHHHELRNSAGTHRKITRSKPERRRTSAELAALYQTARITGSAQTANKLLVLQERGYAGKSHSIRNSLRSMGLKHPGQAAVLPDTNANWGYCKSAAHTISVYLVVKRPLSRFENARDGDSLMGSQLDAAIRQEERGRIAYKAGEYLEWRRNPASVSLTWSSTYDLERVLHAIDSLLGEVPANAVGAIKYSGQPIETYQGADLLQIAAADARQISFLRVNYEEISLLWALTEDAVRQVGDVHGELALIFGASRAQEAESVLKRTATSRIGKIAHRAVQNVLANGQSE